jgi:hypothetical protein
MAAAEGRQGRAEPMVKGEVWSFEGRLYQQVPHRASALADKLAGHAVLD